MDQPPRLEPDPSFTDRPQSTWTRTRYGDTGTRAAVEGIGITGTGHTLPQAGMLAYAYAYAFLGLDGGGGGSATGPLRSVGRRGKCLDVPNQSTTAGTRLQVWDCWNGPNQQWTSTTTQELAVYSGDSRRCPDVENAGTTAGTLVIIWTCHGAPTRSGGSTPTVRSPAWPRDCALEVTGGSTTNGTSARLWTCNGQDNQKWNRV